MQLWNIIYSTILSRYIQRNNSIFLLGGGLVQNMPWVTPKKRRNVSPNQKTPPKEIKSTEDTKAKITPEKIDVEKNEVNEHVSFPVCLNTCMIIIQ